MRSRFVMHRGLWLLMVIVLTTHSPADAVETLETQLKKIDAAKLAKRAHVLGDRHRGAFLFYRNQLGCLQCHAADNGGNQLGPQLASLGERATYAHVIESLLTPSKVIHPDYQTERVLLDDGRVLTGILQSENDASVSLLVPGQPQPTVLDKAAVEARAAANSIMPAGLSNALQEESDFYDLVCFLVELGRLGPDDADQLKPADALIAPPPLPEYEKDLDHQGLIASWNDKSFKQGKRLYNELCINCHGTIDQPGSLPGSLRFASEPFRNGADPLSMYRTITHGYRMMLPQRQLVPREKYDVIHYIREAYVKPHNPSQYVRLDATYMASLPKGRRRGPSASRSRPWIEMDYGPFLTHTYEVVTDDDPRRPGITKADRQRARREGRPPEHTWPADTNFAFKGIAIQLDDAAGGISGGKQFVIFEHDTLRIAGVWSGNGFIDWEGILLDGKHWRSPRTVGNVLFQNLPGPGWANPDTASFDDTRKQARDGRAYGPFSAAWMDYRGLYKHGNRIVLRYTVGDADVLESHRSEQVGDALWFTRSLNVGRSENNLVMRVAPADTVLAAVSHPELIRLDTVGDDTVVHIPADVTPIRFEVTVAATDAREQPAFPIDHQVEDLSLLTRGGPSAWPEIMTTSFDQGDSSGPLAVDTLTRPVDNRWKSRLRLSGLDFMPDGTMVACCCDGDVWMIRGVTDDDQVLHWKRIASGLFHPLGIKVFEGRIFVGCRDQIVILNDLNGDGEADFYESFNHDHQVTEHFHEFAMGLQADDAGNFYYAKSARHALDSLIPQHGTLLRVDADGRQTTIVANGFRAANGVCLNPDGSFFVTDQEGHWTPMNRVNRVVEGGFYGNMYSYGAPKDSSDTAMTKPLCWPNKPFDRSPAELLWVDSDRWSSLDGSLLSLSYGYGKVFVVPHEQIDGVWQGGMCRLPLPQFETGVMRGRFSPFDGHLYVCGMNAWGSSQSDSPGGLYRIRPTGQPIHVPIGFHAHRGGLTLTFSDPVDRDAATDPNHYLIETWDLTRSANYGSPRSNERHLSIESIEVSQDGRSITLRLPEIAPTWTIQIAYKLRGPSGQPFGRILQGTIHQLSTELD